MAGANTEEKAEQRAREASSTLPSKILRMPCDRLRRGLLSHYVLKDKLALTLESSPVSCE